MAALGVAPRLSSPTLRPLTPVPSYPSYLLFLLGMTCAAPYACFFIKKKKTKNLSVELGARVWGPAAEFSGMKDF